MKRASITIVLLLFPLFLLSMPAFPVENNFIREWLVLGTFPNSDERTMLSNNYIPNEKDAVPSSGDSCSGKVWRSEHATEAGNLDFNRMGFDVIENCAVYAHIYVHSEEERNVMVLIGSDDGVMLYVNGKVVHSNLVWRGWAADTDRVMARIGKGWNRFLFKIFNGSGGFDLSARITSTDGEPIAGLKYSIEDPYRGKNFIIPDVKPWLIVDKVQLGTNLKVVGKKYVLPVSLSLRNIGTREAKGVAAYLLGSERGSKGEERVILRKNFPLEGAEGREIEVFLEGKDLLSLLRNDASLTAEIEWNGKAEEKDLSFNEDDLLEAIFSARPERIPAGSLTGKLITKPSKISGKRSSIPEEVAEKLDYLHNNFRWARFFLGDRFKIQEGYAVNLAKAFFANDWTETRMKLDALIESVKKQSLGLKNDTVSFTGNAHIDMAWLWKYDETIQVCYETFSSALDFAGRYPDFVYAQSQAQAYWWMERRFPDLFKRIQEEVRKGQWEIVGGMWVEPDLNIPSGESIVRQILYGKRYFREKFGVDVKVGYNPDTFGYNLTLPQILKRSGIDYFITQKLGWNDTNKFPYRLFWWQSPDGSRILTYFPYTYVHDARIERVATQFKDFREMTGTGDQLVLYGVGNHGGGPTQQNIDNIEEMKKLDAFPTVKESKILDFMETVTGKERADDRQRSFPPSSSRKDLPDQGILRSVEYPLWKDELYLETHRGVLTTQAANKKNNRISEILLEEAEKYAVLSAIDYPSDELQEAWRLTLFNQFHDILPGSSIHEVYVDSSVQYAFVKSLAERVIDRALTRVSERIHYKSGGIPIVVFNPLSWKRTGYVRIDPPEGFNETMGMLDAAGRERAYELIDGEIIFLAENVPSLGYTTFYLREGHSVHAIPELKADENHLENEFLRVSIDGRTGNIVSIFDKTDGREILEPGKGGNVLELFEDIPSDFDAWNIGYTGKEWKVENVRSTPVKSIDPFTVSLRIERTFGDSTFIQDLKLHAGIPRLDIENTIDWHENHKLLKAAFNLAVGNDYATYEIPYGTIERATVPKNSFDRAKYEVSGHKFIDLTDRSGDYGVSMFNDCKYGFDIRGSEMRITLLRAPTYPDPAADRGKHQFIYSIYPHIGDWRQGQSFRRAYELNYPLRAVPGRSGKQDPGSEGARGIAHLPDECSLISSSSSDIMITSVKKAEDSNDIIVRFYELHGRQHDAEITFDAEPASVSECTLMEEPLRSLEAKGRSVIVPVNGHEIKTLMVRFKRADE